MLADLRQALTDTIKAGMPEARVLAAPPKTLEFPPSGVLVYLRPANDYVSAYLSFGPAGRGTVNIDVVVTVLPSDANDVEPSWKALDDAVDPKSTGGSVFAALFGHEDLGVSDAFEFEAQPQLSPVQAPDLLVDADGNVTRYEAVVPVQITVKRS